MIPEQILESYPVFGDNATKISPDPVKYAAGFQPTDVLPAEWMNWAWNKNTKCITALNEGILSIEKEINNILTQAGILPSASDNTQVYKAIRSFIAAKTNTMICTTGVDEAPAVSGYDYINEYYDGLAVEVLFKNGYYGADASANLTFEIGDLGAKKVYAPKDGETVLVKSNSVDRADGHGTKNWFMQSFTSLKMMYDSSLDDNAGGWVVLDNAVVLSNSNSTNGYTIYADGKTIYHVTRSVSFGNWGGGSTQPYIPFKTAEIDLSSYNKIHSITPRSKTGLYNDRFNVTVIGMTSDKHYLIGCWTNASYVNPFTDGGAYLDIIAE